MGPSAVQQRTKCGQSVLEKYQSRPFDQTYLEGGLSRSFQQIFLIQLAAGFSYKKPKWCKRKKEVVVRVFPRLTLGNDPFAREDYFVQQVSLLVPWVFIQELRQSDKITLELAYERYSG